MHAAGNGRQSLSFRTLISIGDATATRPACELHSEKVRAPIWRHDPRAVLPWRVVPHVLGVPAFELGHPMAFGVGVKSNDSSCWRCIRRHGRLTR